MEEPNILIEAAKALTNEYAPEAGVLGLASALIWFTKKADAELSDHRRRMLWDRLVPWSNDEPRSSTQDQTDASTSLKSGTALTILDVFEGYFGESMLTWRAFGRSALATTVAFIICGILFGIHRLLLDIHIEDVPQIVVGIFWILLAALFVSNILVDYLSFFETRYFAKLIGAASPRYIIPLLIAELLATTIILFFAVILYSIAVSVAGFGFSQTPILLSSIYASVGNFFDVLFLSGIDGNITRALAATTYFTSVWLWLILLATHAYKLGTVYRLTVAFLTDWLKFDMEKPQPCKLLGLLVGIVCAAFGSVLLAGAGVYEMLT